MEKYHITIVGAGPTGLTAAIELARRGVIARVVDKKKQASTLSRAVGILPTTLMMLEASQTHALLLHDGIQVQQSRIFFDKKPVLTLDFEGMHSSYDFILCLPQDKTEALLMDTFRSMGGEVFYDHEVKDVQEVEHGVMVHYAHGLVEQTDILIGADGVHSQVRKALTIEK